MKDGIEFFTEKESYEAFQETIRILSLDEQQLEKEFSDSNLNPFLSNIFEKNVAWTLSHIPTTICI